MRAILLAGGMGTRLKPYTTVIPKPLMPVGNMPILEIIIRQLAHHGFTKVTITLGYLGKLIEVYFGDGSQFGLEIDYSREDKPLGTIGPLKLIRDLPENFLVMNGDILSDVSFSDFYGRHVREKSIFSVSTYHRQVPTELGVLDLDKHDRVVGFREKPILGFQVSMGIYMANREVLKLVPENQPFGFDQLMLKLIDLKKSPSIHRHEGYWLDIGRTEDYALAQEEFEKIRDRIMPFHNSRD